MSFTMPAELATSIGAVAARLKITRSALLAQLLTEPLIELQKLIDLVPEQPTVGDVRRFRGESIATINKLVTEVQELVSGLDPHPELDL